MRDLLQTEVSGFEKNRIKALESYQILGTPPEKDYDNLTKLAALICETPVAIISLVHEEKQVFKSIYGMEGCSTSREDAICNLTIQHPDQHTIIEDTSTHYYTKDNLSVKEANMIFYAGYPIVDDDGYPLGTICVTDFHKRTINEAQKEALKSIANQILQLLKLRKRNLESKKEKLKHQSRAKRFESIIEATNVGTWEWNIQSGNILINDRFAEMLGYTQKDLKPFTIEKAKKMLHPSDLSLIMDHIKKCLGSERNFLKVKFRLKHANNSWVTVKSQGKIIEWENDQPMLFYGSNTDITKEMIIEAQLNTVNNNLPAFIYRYQLLNDGSDKFLYASKGIEDLWKVSAKEALKDLNICWEKVVSQDLETLKKSIIRSATTLTEWSCEWRMKIRPGEIRWTRGKGKPQKGEDGSIIWDSIIIDVTEEKLLELKLNESNEKLQIAQRISNLGYWELDLNSMQMAWSDQVYTILNVTNKNFSPQLEDLLGLIHPEDRNLFELEISEVRKGKKEINFEHRILLPGGIEKWVRQTGNISEINKNETPTIEATIQDITSQKLTSLELKETLQKYIHLDKATSDTMWDWHIPSNLLYWSENFTNNFGHEILKDASENLKIWENNIHPEDRTLVLKTFRNIVNTKDSIWVKEYRFRRKNGDYAHILDKGFIIRDEDQNAVRVIGAMQDVTKIKKNEQLLIKLNEDLEEKAKQLSISNKELEHFAYVASHDLQEPLRMISSFLGLLDSKYGHLLDEKGKKYIHFAIDGSKRMKDIILDLLDYSRVNNINEKPQELDLEEILDEVKLLNRKLIQERKAVFHVSDLPVIRAYRTPVFRIFYNLINNALKYQAKGNKPLIRIDYSDTENYHLFSVSDNGIGIEEEYFEKIFIIFQRLHLRDQYSGTGMGLAITKKFVESLRGDISVKSTVGKGTTFTFSISKYLD